jgi:hypothetical protein
MFGCDLTNSPALAYMVVVSPYVVVLEPDLLDDTSLWRSFF